MKIRLYREKEDIQIKRPLDILSQCQCLGDDGEREIYDRAEVEVIPMVGGPGAS